MRPESEISLPFIITSTSIGLESDLTTVAYGTDSAFNMAAVAGVTTLIFFSPVIEPNVTFIEAVPKPTA